MVIRAESSALSKCTGAILAGGRSSRFGSNKALADFRGKPVIAWIKDRLRTVLGRIIVIAGSSDEYRFLDAPVFPDVFPSCGPVGGIHAALTASFTPWVFVTACDVPLVSCHQVRALAGNSKGADAVCFTVGGSLMPLPLLLGRHLRLAITRSLHAGELALHRFLRKCRLGTVPVENSVHSIGPAMFINVNKPEELYMIGCQTELSARGQGDRPVW